jgi:hypothetical protein
MADDEGAKPNTDATNADGKKFDESYVKELRGENAARRNENKELKEQLAGVSEKLNSLTDGLKALAGVKPNDTRTDPVQALASKVDELTKGLTMMTDKAAKAAEREGAMAVESSLRVALRDAGPSAGHEVDDLLKLMPRDGVAYDPETRTVAGVAEAVANFAKARPAYFGGNVTPPPPGTPGGGTPRSVGHPAPPTPSEAVQNAFLDLGKQVIAGEKHTGFIQGSSTP